MTRQHDLWVDNERQDRALKNAAQVIAEQKAEIAVLAETVARLSRELAQAEQEVVALMYAGRRLVEAADPVIEALS